MRKISKVMVIAVLLISLLVGCTGNTNNGQANDQDNINNDNTNDETQDDQDNVKDDNEDEDKTDSNDENKNQEENANDEDEDEEVKKDPKELIDLSLKPNEAGQIMVLMYHGVDKKEDTWVRTPENLMRDLEVLYEKGYRAISLTDFVNNDIEVEAGYTPVVFTIDDGLQNGFNIIEQDGEKVIDPNCAVGVMEAFKEKHPDFNMTATFFVNGFNPFRQEELIGYKLNWLVENGYDVGNHTTGHNNMSEVSDPSKMQKYIGEQANFLESFLDDYKVNTYALAYGARPDDDLEYLLEQGEYDGHKYKNIAILNVGWDPSVSPIDVKFNPLAIHRVRASEMNVDNVGMYNWLDVFDRYPERRFISDGDSNIVTVPKKYEGKVDKEKIDDNELYIYEVE
ncbi:polysaccharide deacetylase family protein [Sporosalibacterium faouarense]|uniref:polysaccharide deacetylase family protein n=1 Tax=Sporosalibacterium faouarense TaxID=516123 RepID=UPI00141C3114|nr:polysaccharide deacetylase family protein [Sporosalibacterium faouarense]MTI49549.1 polysaccharide deacetylase [Bacillota bacterium]